MKINKLRLVIFISIILLLLLTYIIVNKNDQIQYYDAKQQLEKVINKSYDENTNTVDEGVLKENIKQDLPDSKLSTPKDTKFPVIANVKGHQFEVLESGKIEEPKVIETTDTNNNNQEEIVTQNISNNNVNQNEVQNSANTINNVNTSLENIILDNGNSNEIFLNFLEETKSYKGVDVTVQKDGTISFNGNAQDRIFIKVTNGIDMATDGNLNTALAKKEPALIKSGSKINIDITEISGECVTRRRYSAI